MKKTILWIAAFAILLCLSVVLLSCGGNQKAPEKTTGTKVTAEAPAASTTKGTEKKPETTAPVTTDSATTEPALVSGMSPAEDPEGSAWGNWIPSEKPAP